MTAMTHEPDGPAGRLTAATQYHQVRDQSLIHPRSEDPRGRDDRDVNLLAMGSRIVDRCIAIHRRDMATATLMLDLTLIWAAWVGSRDLMSMRVWTTVYHVIFRETSGPAVTRQMIYSGSPTHRRQVLRADMTMSISEGATRNQRVTSTATDTTMETILDKRPTCSHLQRLDGTGNEGRVTSYEALISTCEDLYGPERLSCFRDDFQFASEYNFQGGLQTGEAFLTKDWSKMRALDR